MILVPLMGTDDVSSARRASFGLLEQVEPDLDSKCDREHGHDNEDGE